MVSALEFCQTYGFEPTYWIAYSGGLDSHVLLHHFAQLRQHHPLKLKAVHIHHGLSANADQWAAHCAQTCAELKIDFILRKINVDAVIGESREDIARQLRYNVFTELLSENDLLLTAHHQNDQAETVLLQLLRGSGPKGLAAMPRIKKLGKGWHARPLLDVTREELKHYADQAQLKWVEDESNVNVDYSRNFLRHEILPLLQNRWPTVAATLARVAKNCAETQQVLENIIQQDLYGVKGTVSGTLSVAALKKYSSAHQSLMIREWLHQQHFPSPPEKKMQQVLMDMLQADEDKSPHIQWGSVEMRRYRGDLYAMKISSISDSDLQEKISWNLRDPLNIPGMRTLQAVPTKGQGLKADIQQVTVRFRQGGEVCRLPGRDFHHSLKNLFQEWGVPQWERDRVPLIYVKDELAAVVGYVVCEGFAAEKTEEAIIVSFKK